jgi:hypothetical protein
MKTQHTLLSLLAASSILVSGCQTPRTTANKWEYKVVEKYLYVGDLQKQIDAQVADGWEFVTVSTAIEPGSTPRGFIVFRKPKQ